VRHFINLRKLFAGKKFWIRAEIKYPNFQAISWKFVKILVWGDKARELASVGAGEWGKMWEKVLLANDFFILVYH
jgi:hypothetical protein